MTTVKSAGSPVRPKKEPTAEELARIALKWEAAGELGLAEKVRDLGWGGLSAAEAGRVGARIAKWIRDRSRPPRANP